MATELAPGRMVHISNQMDFSPLLRNRCGEILKLQEPFYWRIRLTARGIEGPTVHVHQDRLTVLRPDAEARLRHLSQGYDAPIRNDPQALWRIRARKYSDTKSRMLDTLERMHADMVPVTMKLWLSHDVRDWFSVWVTDTLRQNHAEDLAFLTSAYKELLEHSQRLAEMEAKVIE